MFVVGPCTLHTSVRQTWKKNRTLIYYLQRIIFVHFFLSPSRGCTHIATAILHFFRNFFSRSRLWHSGRGGKKVQKIKSVRKRAREREQSSATNTHGLQCSTHFFQHNDTYILLKINLQSFSQYCIRFSSALPPPHNQRHTWHQPKNSLSPFRVCVVWEEVVGFWHAANCC